MIERRLPLRGKDFAMLFTLGALWGASFLFIKEAVLDGLSPFFVVAARLTLGTLGLLAIILISRSDLRLREWQGGCRPFLIIGLLNAALPYVLLTWAENYISSGLSSILNATTPLWTVLLANYWPGGERFTTQKVVGVVIGLLGVIVAASSNVSGAQSLFGIAAVVGMAVCYSISNLYVRNAFRGTAPLFPAIGQVAVGAALVIPFALFNLPDHLPSLKATGSLLALGVLGTAIAFYIYFWLIAHVGPTRTSTVTYLLPMFGLIYGAIFLREGELFTWNVLLGLALVLTGITVTGGAATLALRRLRGVPRETVREHEA
jgi:drug/metabolite transporter (DMT)-like permease